MMQAQSPDPARKSARHPRPFLQMLTWSLLLIATGAIFPARPATAAATMNLTIVNDSGYPDDQVYFIVVSQTPLGYFDFRNRVLVPVSSFTLDTATMTASLAQLREYSGDGSATIRFPTMGSARIYFALGHNFDQMGGGFASSGPVSGPANQVPYDKFEFDLSHSGFINSTMVDFFSIAYTLTATRETGETATVGVTNASATIFNQFAAIPSPADAAQQFGNPDIFKACIVKNAAGEVVRILSPKTPGYSDISAANSTHQKFSHYWNAYITDHCWKPGRTFSFTSKITNDPTIYHGKVSADGLTLALYTDAALTAPYTVPSLPRPCNDWGNPDFASNPGYWHNVGITSTVPNNIDWGYLLAGQDGWSSGPGAYWNSDPLAMAIVASIVRGVMHLDNGTVDWRDSTKYYQGTNGAGTAEFPIFYYGQILHRYGLAGHVYAIGYDDVYGAEPSITFNNPAVTMKIYPFHSAPTVVTTGASDYDGDHKADPTVVGNGAWKVWMSSAGYQPQGPFTFAAPHGSPLLGATDFDGDQKADPAMVASNAWYVWMSSMGYPQLGPFTFAAPGAGQPVAADFDGDHKADPAMAVNGAWYVWFSSEGYSIHGPLNFGGAGQPLAADFDGDRLADPAMAANGAWTVWMSSAGYAPQGPYPFAVSVTDPTPVAGDFDGDGFADPAMTAGYYWIVWMSSAGYAPQGPFPFIP